MATAGPLPCIQPLCTHPHIPTFRQPRLRHLQAVNTNVAQIAQNVRGVVVPSAHARLNTKMTCLAGRATNATGSFQQGHLHLHLHLHLPLGAATRLAWTHARLHPGLVATSQMSFTRWLPASVVQAPSGLQQPSCASRVPHLPPCLPPTPHHRVPTLRCKRPTSSFLEANEQLFQHSQRSIQTRRL